jgi:hypothetical protein
MSLVPTDSAVPAMGAGLLGIQRRYRELGRLRMGEKGTSKNGGSYPRKLAEWRLTSQSRELLDVAASLYGGTVGRWEGAPTEGVQWELRSGTDRLDVLVPPGQVLSQYFELWSGGGCVRRCNGMAQTTGELCACPADLELRSELAKDGKACKPTTRLSVILPRIPDIGVWRVESHGMNAAVEIPGTVDILRQALEGGVMIPAQLRMEQRTSKKDGETRHFVVPVLELPTVTIAALSAEGVKGIDPADMPALRSAERDALPAPSAPSAPKAAPKSRARRETAPPPPLPPLPGSQPPIETASSEAQPLVAEVEGIRSRHGALAAEHRETYNTQRKDRGLPSLDDLHRWTPELIDQANAFLDEITGETAGDRRNQLSLAEGEEPF